MKAIEVKVSYYLGFGHSGGRYSERTRTKQVADKVAEQLQSLLDAKKAAKKKPLELTHGEIKQAIADGADVLLSLHNDLLKSDTSTGYVITKVTTAPKSKKIETIRDADGVRFSKDGKILLACSKPLGKEYIIPKKVRSIQSYAFYENAKEVETIYLHSKIEKIGHGVWVNCPNLRAIVVDEANPYYLSEDGVLYNKDKTCLIKFPPKKECTEFHVPLSVREIASNAFCLCENLTSLVLHDDIQRIGLAGLSQCGFTSIHIPTGIEIIEPYAFSCSKLTSVVIPSNVKTIAENAFIYSYDLAHVEFSQGLERIEKNAFECTKIREVELPKSAKQVSKRAFGFNKEYHVYDPKTGNWYTDQRVIIKYKS